MSLYKSQRLVGWFSIAMTAILLLVAISPALADPAQASPAAAVCTAYHRVKAGETLKKIAKTYSVTIDALATANGLSPSSTVTKGSQLCIPQASKSELQAKLNVQASKGQVTISGSGFSKARLYVVRARDGDLGPWFNIGRITSEKNGALTAKTFTLPSDLKTRTFLTVCLKNQLSDQLTCKNVVHIR